VRLLDPGTEVREAGGMQASVRVAAAIVVASVVGSACGKPDERPAAAAGSAPAEAGLGSVDDVARAIDEALALGAATWPGAQVGGARVGPAVPRRAGISPGLRRNVYTARVSFEAAAPDAAPTGAIDCNPRCAVVPPGTIRRPVAPPFPCGFADALAAARRAGLTATQPLITYGYWSEQGRTGWTFQASAGAAIIEVGAGCAVMP